MFKDVAFDPSGTILVAASGDKTLRIWDAASGALIRTLASHTDMVRAAVLRPDGTRIVTASNDKSARVLDATSSAYELLRLTGHTGWVRAVAFSPDGTHIVSGSQDNTARVWDAKSGLQLLKLEGHDRPISAVVFSPDSVCRLQPPRRIRQHGSGTPNPARNCANLRACQLDLQRGLAVQMAPIWPPGPTTTRRGYSILSSDVPLLEFHGHNGPVLSVAFSHDGTRLLTGSFDNTARIWDAKSAAQLFVLTGHNRPINSAQFSPDDARVATASDDNSARIWSAKQNLLHELPVNKNWVRAVDVNAAGIRLATGSEDRSAKLWDVKSGALVLTPAGHSGAVAGVAFSPDGERVVTASQDKTARV